MVRREASICPVSSLTIRGSSGVQKKKKTVNVGIYLAAGCKTWTAAEEKSNLCGDCEI